MFSTAGEYARFCQMLLNGGELDGVRILSPKTIALMTSDQLDSKVERHTPVAAAIGPFSRIPRDGHQLVSASPFASDPGRNPMPGSVGDFSWGGITGTLFWVNCADQTGRGPDGAESAALSQPSLASGPCDGLPSHDQLVKCDAPMRAASPLMGTPKVQLRQPFHVLVIDSGSGNMLNRTAPLLTIATIAAALLLPTLASAHNVSKRDAIFVQSTNGVAISPFVYLGAKHMVTGYDHLAFLVGVIFFLYRLKDIVLIRQSVHSSATASLCSAAS